MLVMSSPSGAGKTTITRALLQRDDNLSMSVSATTRAPREGEVDAQDYVFLDKAKFEDMVKHGEFLEHAKVFDNYYGTPRAPVEEALNAGKDVLFDVDWQGARDLRHAVGSDDQASVFILPPSHEELERRLYDRGQDSDEVVKKRMSKAGDEMSHWGEYDYVVFNIDIEESVAAVQAILTAERHKRIRQRGLPEFVRSMCVEE